jgi:hypothetical protein
MDLKILKDMAPWDWPDGAGTEFLRVLRDEKAHQSDHLLAAELAGNYVVFNDELAQALLTVLAGLILALAGEDPEVRRKCFEYLKKHVVLLMDEEGESELCQRTMRGSICSASKSNSHSPLIFSLTGSWNLVKYQLN